MRPQAQPDNILVCAVQASSPAEETRCKLNSVETEIIGPTIHAPRSTIARALSILRKGGINIRVREAEIETMSFELFPADKNGITYQTIPFLPLDDSINYLLENGARRISTPQPSLDQTTDSHFPPVRKADYELELNGQKIRIIYN